MKLHIDAWNDGASIPARYAFGKPGEDEPFATSDNISPALRWEDAPEGTRSFAIVVVDRDVPSSGEDVNQKGKTVPKDLPRVEFFHWLLADVPASTKHIEEGASSNGVTPRGKPVGPVKLGVTGSNGYTGWFAEDPDMAGTYGGYDGPCPPWNDSIIHHYHFQLLALDVETLGLEGAFGAEDLRSAMEGHILAEASWMGTYTMNPELA